MTVDMKWMILQGVGPVQVRVLDDGSVEVHERDEAEKSTDTFSLTALEAAEDLRSRHC